VLRLGAQPGLAWPGVARARVCLARQAVGITCVSWFIPETRSEPDYPLAPLIGLREKGERDKHGIIPGSLHAPYPDLQENISAGGMLHELARRLANGSCSTAPSASARRWQCRPRRTRASRPPVTSRAASTLGKRLTDPWRGSRWVDRCTEPTDLRQSSCPH
jgi:hypothetical protein